MRQARVETSSRVTQRKQMFIKTPSLSSSLSSSSMKWPQVTTPFQVTHVGGSLCRMLDAASIYTFPEIWETASRRLGKETEMCPAHLGASSFPKRMK